MWEKIKDLKLIIGIIAAAIPAIIALGTWTSANIVFASDFNRFKSQEAIRWLNYDEQRLRSEYYNLRNLRELTARDKRRLDEVNSELDLTTKRRLQIEKEQRHISMTGSIK